jgi:hypothetical protein
VVGKLLRLDNALCTMLTRKALHRCSGTAFPTYLITER